MQKRSVPRKDEKLIRHGRERAAELPKYLIASLSLVDPRADALSRQATHEMIMHVSTRGRIVPPLAVDPNV